MCIFFFTAFRAKQRKLNNASESTLSSYGYLLIMINYLQSLDPPVLPVLNLLPLDWDGTDAGHLEEGSDRLPNMSVPSADGRLCNVYFYQPDDEGSLRAFGARNTMGLGELFLGFFYHMSTQFDFQRSVVSARTKDPFVSKDIKIKEDSWRRHRRLSIEDPFERYYDVAHPVREHKHRLIRAEMAVGRAQHVQLYTWRARRQRTQPRRAFLCATHSLWRPCPWFFVVCRCSSRPAACVCPGRKRAGNGGCTRCACRRDHAGARDP